MLSSFPNLQSVKRLFRYEVKRIKRRIPSYTDALLRQVLVKGYAVVPNYWSKEKCEISCDKIDRMITDPSIKVWTDECQADHRVMGVENLEPDLDLMSNSLLSLRLKNLFGTSNLSGFNMASKISFVPNNLGSGQGWHRDVAVDYQFKAILYLSDVDTHSGPFQYYNKSGNCLAMLNLERKAKLPIDQNRFTEKEAKLFDQRCITEVCAPAGTLILANTRGIHRGKPILLGNRYALTSYQWPHAIPNHIQPYVN